MTNLFSTTPIIDKMTELYSSYSNICCVLRDKLLEEKPLENLNISGRHYKIGPLPRVERYKNQELIVNAYHFTAFRVPFKDMPPV